MAEKKRKYVYRNTYVMDSYALAESFGEEAQEAFEAKHNGLCFYDPRYFNTLQFSIFKKEEKNDDGVDVLKDPDIVNVMLGDGLTFTQDDFNKLVLKLKEYIHTDLPETANSILSWKINQFLHCLIKDDFTMLIEDAERMKKRNDDTECKTK